MKRLLMILATIVLSISIVGCSSSSKKYDNDIQSILEKKKLERKNVNIEVYDVNYNLDGIKGQHNTYKVTHQSGKRSETDIFILDSDKKVKEFTEGDEGYLSNMLQKKVYEENNNKNLKAEF